MTLGYLAFAVVVVGVAIGVTGSAYWFVIGVLVSLVVLPFAGSIVRMRAARFSSVPTRPGPP